MNNLAPFRKRHVWAENNIQARSCRHAFGLPRIKPPGWQRYQGMVSVRYYSVQSKCKGRRNYV